MPVVVAAIPAALAVAAEAGIDAAGITIFGATFTGLSAALIAGGATLAIGTVANLLNSPGAATNPTRNGFSTDPNAPRRWCYGRSATGPQMAYWETVGNDNEFFWMAGLVHHTPCDGFELFYANNVRVDFSGNAATPSHFTITGSVTSGSATVVVASTTGIQAGDPVISGPFPGNTKVFSVDSPTQFRMSKPATSTASAASITLGPSTYYCDGDGSNPRMWRYDHLGSETQTADTSLVAASATGTGYWTSQCRLQGIAYFVWELAYNTNFYPTGIPEPLLILRGRQVWDPRQDTAYGGTGSQSRSNPSTWTWSQNAALCLLDYLLGVQIAGVRIGGCGVPVAALDIDSFITAANICDQSVALANGGTEARYTINGFVDADEDKLSVVQAMLQAMDGMLVYRGGYIALIAGAAQSAVISLSDDDLADTLTTTSTLSRQDKYNAVTSTYADPNQLYQVVNAPLLQVADYVTADGGVVLEKTLKHRFTTSLDTVQRLNKLLLANIREQYRIDATFKPKALLITVGATFNWSSSAAGVANLKMICLQRDLQEDGSVHIIARQETDAKYDWSTSEVQAPPTFNVNAKLDPTQVTAPASGDVSVSGVSIDGANGAAVPALLLSANLPPSPFVLRILTQWKLSSDTTWKSGPSLTPSSPSQPGYITGLAPGVDYDVEFAYQTLYAVSEWTEVSGIAAGGSLVATGATPNSIDTSALQDDSVTTQKIDDAAVTTDKLDDAAITAAKFAAGLTVPQVVSTLPATAVEGDLVVLTTDGQLYRYHSGAWTTEVPAVSVGSGLTAAQIVSVAAATITGTIVNSQIAAGAIAASNLAAGITAPGVGSSLPVSGASNPLFFNSTDGQLYRWNSATSAWTVAVAATSITGTLTAAQIASVAAASVTGTLTSSQIAAVAAATITGTLVNSQIGAAAIQATQLAASAVTAPAIAAGAVVASKMFIGSTDNLILDGNCADLGYWTGTGLSVVQVSGYGTTNALEYPSDATSQNLTSSPIACQPGDSFQIACVVGSTAGAQTFVLYGEFFAYDGTFISNVVAASLTTAGPAAMSGNVITPAGAALIRLFLNQSGSSVGNILVGSPVIRRRYTGSLIVDGTITAVQIASATITSAQIAAGTIVASNIAAATITGTQIAASTIAAANIVSGTITSAQIAASTITGSNIAAGTITASNIQAGSITSTQIAANTIIAGNVAAGAIGATQLAAQAVTASKVYIGSTDNLILDGTCNDLSYWTVGAGAAITSGVTGYGTNNVIEFSSNATSANLTSPRIACQPQDVFLLSCTAGSTAGAQNLNLYVSWYTASGSHISDITVQGAFSGGPVALSGTATAPSTAYFVQFFFHQSGTSIGNIRVGAPVVRRMYTGSLIVNGTITAANIQATTITSAQIAAGTIVAGNIAVGTITSTQIAAGTITGTNIAASTITSGNIAANAITAGAIAAGAVNASTIIVSNIIVTGHIQANQVTIPTIGTAGTTSIGTSSTTLITLTITTAGENVSLDWAGYFNWNGSGTAPEVIVQVVRDGTTTVGQIFNGGGSSVPLYLNMSGCYLDTAIPAGSHTYVMSAKTIGATGTMQSNALRLTQLLR